MLPISCLCPLALTTHVYRPSKDPALPRSLACPHLASREALPSAAAAGQQLVALFSRLMPTAHAYTHSSCTHTQAHADEHRLLAWHGTAQHSTLSLWG